MNSNTRFRIILYLLSFTCSIYGSTSSADVDFESIIKSRAATALLIQDSGLTRNSTAQLSSKSVSRDGQSDFVQITLASDHLGLIRLLLKGPHGFLENQKGMRFRTLFLTSGFFTGRSAVRLVADEPDLVVAGFEYGYRIEDFKANPSNIFEFVRKTPLQIALSLQWLSKQPWQDTDGLSAMGVSLGGLFLPSGLHIAETIGTKIDGTILAFTGAHLVPVLENLLKNQVPKESLTYGLRLVNNLTALHDPKLHIPFLEGHFLTIRADQEQIFPRESSQILEDLLPFPRTLQVVHGPHIDVDQPAVIRQTQIIVHDWMSTEL